MKIEFTGLDLEYDGTDIFDAGAIAGGSGDPSDADPLTTMAFYKDGSLEGTLISDIAADIKIPDVLSIPKGGGTVSSTDGFFDLLTKPLATAFGLELDIVSLDMIYTGFEIAVFGFGKATEISQDLPLGLLVVPGDIVAITFSTQIDTIADDGTFLTSFTSSGTGEVRADLIPEPSSLLLALLAVGVGGLAALRYRDSLRGHR